MDAAFGEPRNFFTNRYIYLVISQRARGLSLGVNLNPDQVCNFNCVYCEIKRAAGDRDRRVNAKVMSAELRKVLNLVENGQIQGMPCYNSAPEDLLQLREIHLSGDGEPTLCPNFSEVVETVVHLRAMGNLPYYKLVLITNGTGLQEPEVQTGLAHFAATDEIWIKLDAGSQARMELINRSYVPLARILENILALGKRRPIIIQSLFPILHDQEPTPQDIEDYVQRLVELKQSGAQITQVQIYSAHRPANSPGCGHLSLKTLSRIAHRVKDAAGLATEVF